MAPNEIEQTMRELEEEMLAAAEELRFEYAAKLRDEIRDLRRELDAATAPAGGLVSASVYPTSFRVADEDEKEELLDALLPLLPAGVHEDGDGALGVLRRAARPGGAGGGVRARAGRLGRRGGAGRLARAAGAARRGRRRRRRAGVDPLAVGPAAGRRA